MDAESRAARVLLQRESLCPRAKNLLSEFSGNILQQESETVEMTIFCAQFQTLKVMARG